MRLRTLTASTAALALALGLPAAPAFAHGDPADKVVFKEVLVAAETGTGKNMKAVANVPYEVKAGATRGMAGTDVEFARIGGKDYAFAGTYFNGLQIMDITNPAAPVKAAVYDCAILQGDVQVFNHGERILAAYTADSRITAGGANSKCAVDNQVAAGKLGTFLIDVTNPAAPTSVTFIEVPRGSHNMTVHPSGDFLYNSNSDLITSTSPQIEIFDIRDLSNIKQEIFRIPFAPLSLGSESHDITFNADGSRAYSAALSQTLVLDTTNPMAPKLIKQILDPTVQVSHGADPITLTSKAGVKRTFLMISDEQAGAATGTNCPGGGVHIYEITGEMEKAPKKVGTWFIGATGPSVATCTAHVFRMHDEQGLFTIAWYDQGVRVVDVQGLAEHNSSVPFVASGDGFGIREIGSYSFEDSNTWSFKTNRIESDGSFFGYGNDLGRGFDVYRFDGKALGRTVPVEQPEELLAPAAAKKVKADKDKGKKAEALPFVPVGSGPAAAGLLGLLGATVIGANVLVARRRAAGSLTV